jgi:hypothetical protein
MAEHTLQSIAYPVLDEAQIAQAAACTTLAPKHYRDGETLVAVGDRAFKFSSSSRAKSRSSIIPAKSRGRSRLIERVSSRAKSRI